MKNVRRILFVTDELYPFTGGGIGRILHNLLVDALSRPAAPEFHLLVPEDTGIEPLRVQRYFENQVRTHTVQFTAGWDVRVDFESFYPPPGAFTDSSWHAHSLDICKLLRQMEYTGLSFDVIEFPDYRGWAFCALQEKHLGLAFRQTEIVVRLHSTIGILRHFESHPLTTEQLGRFELERKALRDADRVVAHLRPVAEFNSNYYGFERSWFDNVTIEFPPILTNTPPPKVVERSAPRNLVFPTKIQAIKCPDLFVRAVAQFMHRCPDFNGQALFACTAISEEYKQRIRSMVPHDLAGRFLFFESHIEPIERERMIAGHIAVIPSAYESLCLTAYEAFALGATLVLNGKCPAFGDGTPFRHGENCYKFAGSVDDLAEALELAWRKPTGAPLCQRTDMRYWENQDPIKRPAAINVSADARVSVVITNYNLACYLPQTLSSVAASTYNDIEIIIIDDASRNDLDLEIFDSLAKEAATGKKALTVIRNQVNRGLAASRNIAVNAATGKYILPLDADDRISRRFIEIAVNALENIPAFDVVVPQAAYFRTDEEVEAKRFSDYAIFLGDAPSFGLVQNRFSSATSLMRRSLFDRYSYDETLTCYEDWDLYLRLCLSGHRFLVTNDIHFYYRDRSGSMVKDMRDRTNHFNSLARLFESMPVPLPNAVRLFGVLIPAYQEAIEKRGLLQMQARLELLEEQMSAVRASVGWRFVDSWWRLKEHALPLGSFRRKIWDYPVAVLKRNNH